MVTVYIVRRLTPEDAAKFRDLRLYALKETPEAYGSTYEETVDQTVEDFSLRIKSNEVKGSFILGAFEQQENLVGVVGLQREIGIKNSHKAYVWGMYVAPAARRRGVGKLLMSYLMAEARQIPGLERLLLTVVTEKKNALQLYSSFGFQVWGNESKSLKLNGLYFDELHMSVEL